MVLHCPDFSEILASGISKMVINWQAGRYIPRAYKSNKKKVGSPKTPIEGKKHLTRKNRGINQSSSNLKFLLSPLGVARLRVRSAVFQQCQVLPAAAVGPAQPGLRPLPAAGEPPRARATAQPRLRALQQAAARHRRCFLQEHRDTGLAHVL